MSRKGFLVKVEVDIQKVTCPGVWLCSNGKVSLQLYMLDSSIQTSTCKPTFPIYFQEKFVFYKTFANDQRLNELQRSLNNEWFYAELVQWQSCDEGCVLATFQTTLDDLLYPSSFRRIMSGMDIDLLMEPTGLFPGTIAPKLEISTKTTIEETLCDIDVETPSTVINNPKLLISAHSPPKKNKARKVCHSVAFSRALKTVPQKEKKNKPIFQYRKVSDDLILRSNPNVVLRNERPTVQYSREKVGNAKQVCNCYCKSRSMENLLPSQSKFIYRRTSPENLHRRFCSRCAKCNERNHGDVYCPICNKYQDLFISNPSSDVNNSSNNYMHSKVHKPTKLCSHCKRMAKFHVRSSTGSACESDSSEGSKKKVCFCLPSETPSSLAQQLHERLSRTLESNRRFINNCVYCEDTSKYIRNQRDINL